MTPIARIVACSLLVASVTHADVQTLLPWWSAFSNSTLNAAVEHGLARHPDTAAAAAAVESARAARRTAAAEGEPRAELRVGARVGRERTMFTGLRSGDSDPFFGSAELAWELDVLGRIRSRVAEANALLHATEADARGVDLMLSAEIVRSMLTIAAESEQVRLLQAVGTHQAALLQRATRRQEAGLQPGVDRAKSEARLEHANHMAMLIQMRLEKEEATLAALIGDTQAAHRVESISALTLPAAPELGSMTNVVQRPDVASAWRSMQAAAAAADASARERLPTLSVMASAAGELSDDGTWEPWQAWVGPVLELPLWNRTLQTTSRRDSARAERAQRQFESASLSAMRDLAQAATDRRYAEAMQDHMVKRADGLQQVAASAGRRREAGLIQAPEQIRAEMEMLRAQSESIDWQLRALLSHVELVRAWGGDPTHSGHRRRDLRPLRRAELND